MTTRTIRLVSPTPPKAFKRMKKLGRHFCWNSTPSLHPSPEPRLSPGLAPADAISGEAISSLRAISGTFTSSPALPQSQEMFGVFFFPFVTVSLSSATQILWPERWINEQRVPLFTGKEIKINGAWERGARPRSRARRFPASERRPRWPLPPGAATQPPAGRDSSPHTPVSPRAVPSCHPAGTNPAPSPRGHGHGTKTLF